MVTRQVARNTPTARMMSTGDLFFSAGEYTAFNTIEGVS